MLGDSNVQARGEPLGVKNQEIWSYSLFTYLLGYGERRRFKKTLLHEIDTSS